MSASKWIRYEGPRDATHYEMVHWAGRPADIHNLRLDGQRGLHLNPKKAEWGIGIFLEAVQGGEVSNVWVKDVTGDSLTFGCTHPRNGNVVLGPCRGVTVREFTSERAQRNAVAFTGAIGCKLLDSTLVGTHGDLPRGPHAGIDFESDHPKAPNVDNLVERVDVADCQGFAIVSDMGGPTCFGTTVRRSRFISALTGWAALWRASSIPSHPWHVWEETYFEGPVSGMTHSHLRGCYFNAQEGNQHSTRALEIDHDRPVILEHCHVGDLLITPELAREHPALYLHGPNIQFRP